MAYLRSTIHKAMNKLVSTTLLTLSLFSLGCSCSGSTSTDESVNKIDRALVDGNINKAQHECDRFFRERPNLDSLSIQELCQLAIIMASLADDIEDKRDENAAQAVICYGAALKRDSMQTVKYLRSLDTEDYRHVYMLNQLLRPISHREDGVIYSSDENELDSIPFDSIPN